ncbi:MAG: aminoacyl-tRNA hydrolase [Planctomycetota bacterium]|jgi:PTH1 family peptidyl-tRNA hydrolase|nr:aminoacyl-tRNA hydrolase [Planctomycetota bacterium]
MISGPDGGHPPEGQGLRLLVGLGNPGPQYVGTRHNVGFDVLDLFAHRLGIEPEPLTLHGKRWGDLLCSPTRRFALFWPTVFMNRSGGAVLAALQTLEIPPENMLILTDDFHLPLGALRLRASGSCGGHNGLRDVESSLQSLNYPRIRLGVGDPGQDSVDFVLETFRTSDEETVQEMLETASWAAEDWAKGHSLEELQTQYNRRKPQA